MNFRTAILAAGLVAAVIVACGGDGGVSTWTQEGSSMEPSVSHGDEVSIKKYGGEGPERGDIVLFVQPAQGSAPERNYLKRVVGMPGETIEVRELEVLIDGEPLDEPYVLDPPRYTLDLMTIPARHYLVLGDNRNSTVDFTRGPIASEIIIGYVVDGQ